MTTPAATHSHVLGVSAVVPIMAHRSRLFVHNHGIVGDLQGTALVPSTRWIESMALSIDIVLHSYVLLSRICAVVIFSTLETPIDGEGVGFFYTQQGIR